MITKVMLAVSLLSVFITFVSCAPTPDFDSHISSIVRPYRFSIAEWEFQTIPHEIKQRLSDKPQKADDAVTTYLSLIEQGKALNSEIYMTNAIDNHSDTIETELNTIQQEKTALKNTVVEIITRQIKDVLAQEGIFNPIDNHLSLNVYFPPLSFTLENPPYLLVISPRDRIESLKEIEIRQGTNLEQIEDIEKKVDNLGVSSLVVELGGFGGTYPTLVSENSSLRFTIDTAIEEWLHQYLVFKPLGFRYLLDVTGIATNYEIATINEAVASMVSKEIGSMVYEKYYSHHENIQNHPPNSGFDLNREMRDIRKTVDKFLAEGETEQAEEFMRQKQQYLASMGYYIRKLNQAYFAFYGTYADSPTSIDPLGLELKELRNQSPSLKDFLDTVANLTCRQDLQHSLKLDKT